jgi:hypothetical protein
MEEKQIHLNVAHNCHRHRPSLISKIVVTVLAVVGPSVFIVLLILTPKSLKIHVTDAFLVQFNLTTDNTLHYNLALHISIRNPNKGIGLYYDAIQAKGYYDTSDLAEGYNDIYYAFGTGSWITPFYQGHKNTSVLSPVFYGQKSDFLETRKLISKFNNDTSDGVYTIGVELNLSFRTKGGRWIKKGHFNPVIYCYLKVPLSSNGKSAARFNATKCKLDS